MRFCGPWLHAVIARLIARSQRRPIVCKFHRVLQCILTFILLTCFGETIVIEHAGDPRCFGVENRLCWTG